VSAGSSRSSAGRFPVYPGKIPKVERPALASLMNFGWPTPQLLIDSGANVDCRPAFLHQFALVGTIYSRDVLGVKEPRVGLLSNGTEDTKGNKTGEGDFQTP